MAVKIISMVFDRYPTGGGEMLLAISLADHASEDGQDIFPSIKTLATKTRQSERSVQYQLRRMEESGWLILVNSGNGGRNQRREYRISPAWLKGAEIAPPKKGAIDDTKGATDDAKGCNPEQERVQPIAPAYNRQGTVKEPSITQGAKSRPGFDAAMIDLPDWLPQEAWATWVQDRKDRRKPITETAARLQVKQLERMLADGHSPESVIEHTISRGWTGLVAPDRPSAGKRQSPQRFDPVAHMNNRDREAAYDESRTIDV